MNIHTKQLNIPINESLHLFTDHYLNMVRYNMLYSLPAILDLMLSHYQLMKKTDGTYFTTSDIFTPSELEMMIHNSKFVNHKSTHDKIVAFFNKVNDEVLKNTAKLPAIQTLYKLDDGSTTYEPMRNDKGELLNMVEWHLWKKAEPKKE